MTQKRPALIYNLVPLLAGPMPSWESHLERAAGMGFNWIFLNPIHYPGFSGSIYAVKDYYRLNPLIVDPASSLSGEKQLELVLGKAHELGLRVMVDLVINHTSVDSPLVREHPEWYKRDKKGKVKNPGAWEGKKQVAVWGDLAEIDNESSSDRQSLWNYWWELTESFLEAGFDGFRCDAAYKIPGGLWRFLISRARADFPETLFFAESLGCTIEQVVSLAESGFDYVFNSSKYWDFCEPWCLSQYEESRRLAPSVSFPESHDTPRLAEELGGNLAAVRQRYTFAALFSTGVMIPSGFEFGFRKKINVVNTRPEDWEDTGTDMREFIGRINRFKLDHPIFRAEHPTYPFTLHHGSGLVTGVIKLKDEAGPSALFLINRDPEHEQRAVVEDLERALPGRSPVLLCNPATGIDEPEPVSSRFDRMLPPSALWLLMRD